MNKCEQFAALVAEEERLEAQVIAIRAARDEVKRKMIELSGVKVGDVIFVGLTRAKEARILTLGARVSWTHDDTPVLEVFGRAAPLTKDGQPHKSWDVRWQRQIPEIHLSDAARIGVTSEGVPK